MLVQYIADKCHMTCGLGAHWKNPFNTVHYSSKIELKCCDFDFTKLLTTSITSRNSWISNWKLKMYIFALWLGDILVFSIVITEESKLFRQSLARASVSNAGDIELQSLKYIYFNSVAHKKCNYDLSYRRTLCISNAHNSRLRLWRYLKSPNRNK